MCTRILSTKLQVSPRNYNLVKYSLFNEYLAFYRDLFCAPHDIIDAVIKSLWFLLSFDVHCVGTGNLIDNALKTIPLARRNLNLHSSEIHLL